MVLSDCPFCGEEIRWSKKPNLRTLVICSVCRNRSEVVSTSPLELDEPQWMQPRRNGSHQHARGRTRPKRPERFQMDESWEDVEPDFEIPSGGRVRPRRG